MHMMEKIRPSSRNIFGFLLTSIFFLQPTYGQKTILKSSVDESLSIKTVTVAPLADNVSQIYAKPLTLQLRSIVESDRQWDLRSFPEGLKNSPEEFEDKPESVQAALKKTSADALISGRLTKGPNGISIRLNLFLAHDGLLLAQETLQDYSGFEISDLRDQLERMYGNLKSRLPYAGILLSRKGQQVTLNLGTDQGLKAGNELSVVQIIKINRHPRFRFLVSAEKEIIGKVVIDKADASLSFGTIVLERSENVLQPGMKVVPINFVVYPQSPKTADGKIITDMAQRADAPVALGDQPREWVPAPPPSIGKVGLMLGLGSYTISNTLETTGGVSVNETPTPSVHLDGELWLTTNWFMGLGLKQYILSPNNPHPNSSPAKVGISSTQTTLQLGYNFLLQEEFFGPKFQVLGGYSKFSADVDTSSRTAFTSLSFSGLALGIAGSLPISEDLKTTIGAKMMYYLNTDVSESPVSSGSSASGKITSFSAFGTYKWSEHMNLRGELMYDLFGASFSGSGTRDENASSASHTLTTFAGGIEYLF